MSLKTRLGLVAGASLAALYLAAPNLASAQTCSPGTAPGVNPGADTYNCSAGTFPTGIAYSSDGNLTVNMVANGAVVNTTLTANGVDLTGNGADSVTWNSAIGSLTGGAGTGGPVIDALTASGAINVTTGNVSGGTHSIRARSTSGAISISTGSVNTGIEAVTSGNINVTVGGAGGNPRAILTNTSSGSGVTNITTNGTVSAGGGIEAITGTGALTINLNGTGSALATTRINAVRISGNGVGTVNALNTRVEFMEFNAAAATTLNIGTGGILGNPGNPSPTGNDYLFAQGAAAGDVIITNDSNGRISGRFNFAAVIGDITIHNNSGGNAETQGWVTGSTTNFGSGDDLVENGELGVIAGSPNTTFNFGDGEDRFVNAGRFMTDIWSIWGPGHFVMTGLETFENSGLIMLGSEFISVSPNQKGLTSDGSANDRLILLGTDFIGSGASRIALDVNLEGITQADCSVTPVAADCVDFTGGSTAGSTLLTIQDERRLPYRGALNEGITVLVGVSAAEHFTLDPNSDYYAPTAHGGVLQKQLVAYRLVYDEATDRLMFVGTLADEAMQASTYAASAQEAWRSTTGSWLTRQADLRSTPGGMQDSAGAWVRIGGSASEREFSASYVQGAATYDYDLNHKQNTSHLLLGADLLRTDAGEGAVVVGGMIGFVRSDVQFDATPAETISTGFAGGVYASYTAGPLFIDGVLNLNLLHLKAEVPNMSLGEDVPLKQDIRSSGTQIEAGWRVDIGGGAFLEPLGGFSYVVTKFDDFEMPDGGGAIQVDDDYVSLRMGAGLRLGLDSQLMGMTSSYSLTGRYWHETEGENATAIFIANGPTTTELMDDVSGNFSEFAGAVSLYSEGGGVSGFVSLGGRFADDFRSIDGSVGVRLRW